MRKNGREWPLRPGRDEGFDVLGCCDEPILDLLTPQAPPAGTLEVVTIGSLREASFHQVSASATVLLCERTASCCLCLEYHLVFAVSHDGAIGLRFGTRGT